ALALELAPDVPDSTRLRGTAWRVVLGIEVEDDRRAAERLERDLLACIARQRERRCRLPLLDHGAMVSGGIARLARCVGGPSAGAADCRGRRLLPRARRRAGPPAGRGFRTSSRRATRQPP